jgi:hypothetical protein
MSERKINELATNSKNMNIKGLNRGMTEFKRGCQPRNSLVRDDNGNLLADIHHFKLVEELLSSAIQCA